MTMSPQRGIFHSGFGISVTLLIASIASGAGDFGRQDLQDFRYTEMPAIATWATTSYLLLNFPAVVAGALLVAIIRRIFGLSVPTAVVLFPPLCVYLSYFWWHWLSRRVSWETQP